MRVTHSCTRDEIREAYIAPLRSAMIVDDSFPRYEQLVDLVGASANSGLYEYDAAKRVINMCHDRSLVCDVENRASAKLTPEQLHRITKADLVILDYHLTPGDQTDVRPALSILQTLADSDHANLVVIYTKHTLITALRDVFIRFRGIDKKAELPAEYDATDLTEWMPSFDAEKLFAYLHDRSVLGDLIAAARAELEAFGVKKQDVAAVTKAGVELWLKAKFAHVEAPQRVEGLVVARSTEAEPTPWVHFKNVFVAFVSKTDADADVFDSLEAALTSWNPGILRLILCNARNRMVQRGFDYEKIVVGSPERQIGLLYHALGAEEPNAGLQEMLRRLFDSARRQLAADSGQFGTRLVRRHMDAATAPPEGDNERTHFYIQHARAMAHVESAGTDAEIIGALNAFLCSRPFDGSHLFAGTVFRDEQKSTWWLCAAPSCEIVPREPKADKTWRSDIHPSLPMQALRLEEATSLEAALGKATEAKHIFVQFDGRTVPLRVLEQGSGQPRPEMLILHDAGRIDRQQTFKAYAVVKGPELQARTFRVVAQLRNEYADRFLHQTGHHVSRVGVDFVPFRTGGS